jgi:hypothetical protein
LRGTLPCRRSIRTKFAVSSPRRWRARSARRRRPRPRPRSPSPPRRAPPASSTGASRRPATSSRCRRPRRARPAVPPTPRAQGDPAKTVAIGGDHGGYALKESLRKFLSGELGSR